MHDLDPQDQPRRREEETDLAALDADGLSTEARREALRDQRQKRWVRADRAKQRSAKVALENGKQVALIGLLIFAAAGSMAVTIAGLVNQNADYVKAGLVALCAICGGTIYRLGLRG